VDEVEGKHDQLLSSLGDLGPNAAGADDAPTEEPPTSNAPASASASTSANTTVNVPEIKATDAARRKANDIDVNLAEVNGTGADGQITVEDVRKKGES
jgi:pyruvate/2-oxoglutarate dehydrogenase complex dihydrolipoamide acyltransferase (E2) component